MFSYGPLVMPAIAGQQWDGSAGQLGKQKYMHCLKGLL